MMALLAFVHSTPNGAHHGQIRQSGGSRSEVGGQQDQERDAAQRQEGESQEPEAGHCHRPEQGPQEGSQRAAEEEGGGEEEERSEKVVVAPTQPGELRFAGLR
jgi:hypothetical protein